MSIFCKNFLSILIVILTSTVGCEKNDETGEILFCTNSQIGNCGFSIEISVDNAIVGTLTAGSGYSSTTCLCPESSFIGMLVEIETGSHTYYAKELNCVATNRINDWSGSIDIMNNGCKTVILDIIE